MFMPTPLPVHEVLMANVVDVPPLAEVGVSPLRSMSLFRQIREDVGCVRMRDPAARSELETLLLYPGIHAIVWHRIASRLWRGGWRFLGRFVSWLSRLLTNIDIHPGATIGRRFFIDHGAGVVIGETAEVGDDVTLYHGVTLGGTTWSPGKRHPTLEDGVVVGAGAKILGPITVGRGTRVGANSVVIEATPPDVTVVGIPARVVRPQTGRFGIIGRINLDHHLMPDPVGEAISVVLDRLEFLETRVAHLQMRLREAGIRPAAEEAEPVTLPKQV
jgi:serine O-acetyltransferase